MIQQEYKKDYLQRIIEELFAKLHALLNRSKTLDRGQIQELINDCRLFYINSFDVNMTDTSAKLINKIKEPELIEGYAKLLVSEYETIDPENRLNLTNALDLIEYIDSSDKTFSWDRSVLKEDILRLLDESNNS